MSRFRWGLVCSGWGFAETGTVIKEGFPTHGDVSGGGMERENEDDSQPLRQEASQVGCVHNGTTQSRMEAEQNTKNRWRQETSFFFRATVFCIVRRRVSRRVRIARLFAAVIVVRRYSVLLGVGSCVSIGGRRGGRGLDSDRFAGRWEDRERGRRDIGGGRSVRGVRSGHSFIARKAFSAAGRNRGVVIDRSSLISVGRYRRARRRVDVHP